MIDFESLQDELREIGLDYEALDINDPETHRIILKAFMSAGLNFYDFAEEQEELSPLWKAMVPSYARYWHGYLVFLRPLLMFGNISFIRNVSLTVMLLCLAVLIYMMAKRFNAAVTVVFALALSSAQILLVPRDISYAMIFFVAIILSAVMLHKYQRIKEKQHEIYFFFIAGALATFVDLLTVPLMTLLMPLTFYVLLNLQNKEISLKDNIFVMFKSVLGWGLGYGIITMAKWAFSSLVFRQNVFQNALPSLMQRSGVSSEFIMGREDSLSLRIGAIAINLEYLVNSSLLWLILIIAVLGALVAWNILRQKKDVWFFLNALPLLAIALAPFMWYFLISNHSLQHEFMTHRLLAATLFALGTLFIYLYKGTQPAKVPIKISAEEIEDVESPQKPLELNLRDAASAVKYKLAEAIQKNSKPAKKTGVKKKKKKRKKK